MPTILQQLENASWRGVAFPFTGTRDFGFSQEQAQHRFLLRDEQLIESIGRQNPTFRYQLPLYEGIRQFGWQNLFTVVYPKFLAACLDRSAGELIDPVHGQIRAKCMSLAESLSVERQDGVSVVAEFVYAPDEDETDANVSNLSTIASTLEGLQASAVQFGAAVNNLTDEQKAQIAAWRQDSTRGEISILNAGRAAATTAQQYKSRTQAEIAYATTQMEQTRADLEQAQDPELEKLRRDISRMNLAGNRLAETTVAPVSPHVVVRAANDIGRIAFAVQNGVSVDQLIEFNGWLVDAQFIPAGTRVYLPKRGV